MDLYPAVDIRGRRVSRSPDNLEPLDLARSYVDRGVAWIHVVDLDRVFGTGDNIDLVCEVCGVDGVRVQVGGNLDDIGLVEAFVEAGADRVVLGTAAALDARTLDALMQAAAAVQTAVAVETFEGRVYMRETVDTIEQTPERFTDAMVERGIRTMVYRDVNRDGTLAGVDLAAVSNVLGRGASVIYAGGTESLEDIKRAKDIGVDGVIVGRALLEGKFTLEEALACSR